MDLNEARKVIWMKPNRRPMGELFDEGFLDRGRLEWAAKEAYTPKVREAADVFLALLGQPPSATTNTKPAPQPSVKPNLPDINIKMSIDQARSIFWPIPPFKGQPMGSLVETRQLTLKDLGWAIDNAWDQKVREAAVVLSAIRLKQTVNEPEPPKGYLRIVSKGISFSESNQFRLVYLEGLIIGIMLGAALFAIIYPILFPNNSQSTTTLGEIVSTPTGVVVLILALCLVIGIPLTMWLVAEGSTKIINKQIENYRKGQEGEDRVSDTINAALNGEWTLFRNVLLPGRKGGDLDSILVGPGGVWVLEVKTFTGEFRNIGEQWECLAGKQWQIVKSNPSRQGKRNAALLASFLQADHIKIWVKPAIVWANPESSLKVENPSVPIWKLDRLPDELGNISNGRNISEDDQQKINKKLTRLIERQKQ